MEATMKRNRIIGILMGLAMTPFLLAYVRAQAPFYEGKTITIVIGTSSGGSIVAARIIANHLGKYIPANRR
jgi:tripartite-type tricarboxylate transporter receptor subunit TctC